MDVFQCFSWAVRSPRYGRLPVFQLGREVTTVWTSSTGWSVFQLGRQDVFHGVVSVSVVLFTDHRIG